MLSKHTLRQLSQHSPVRFSNLLKLLLIPVPTPIKDWELKSHIRVLKVTILNFTMLQMVHFKTLDKHDKRFAYKKIIRLME